MNHETLLRQTLMKHGYSMTRPRVMVVEELHKMSEPITVADLAKRMNSVDKVSVYRTVDLLESIGLVHRIWTGFKSKIELSESFSSHHHHFTCLNCGRTIDLASDKLEQDLRLFEADYGFKLLHHSVELSGYCENCRHLAAK